MGASFLCNRKVLLLHKNPPGGLHWIGKEDVINTTQPSERVLQARFLLIL